MDDGTEAQGQIAFGSDLDAAMRYWGGYSDFPEGFEHANAVLRVLSSVLGEITSCYVLESRRYAGVRVAEIPTKNAAHVNWGYVWITPAALTVAQEAGVDVREALEARGMKTEGGPYDGLTVWNSRGLRDRARGSPTADIPLRLCPNCFLQWHGDTCPDCEVDLLPAR